MQPQRSIFALFSSLFIVLSACGGEVKSRSQPERNVIRDSPEEGDTLTAPRDSTDGTARRPGNADSTDPLNPRGPGQVDPGAGVPGVPGDEVPPGEGVQPPVTVVKPVDASRPVGFLLAPKQERFSKFTVKYFSSCGAPRTVSQLGIETEHQRRALVYGTVLTVTLFGKGPLRLKESFEVPAVNPPSEGCQLAVDVVSVEPVTVR